MSFDRFMELALYCPGSGYYEKEADTVGRQGDFYTSVSVGDLFGQLLAFQFAAWLEDLDVGRHANGPRALRIVEAGAHDGRLAADILGWFHNGRPSWSDRIQYWLVEPSEHQWKRQQARLAPFAGQVHRVAAFHEIPGGVTGIIFSNELLDAMPVQRFGWDSNQGAWFEWRVGLAGNQFVWIRHSRSLPKEELDGENEVPARLSKLLEFPELLAVLPDGFTVELCPRAEEWWRGAASALQKGKLLTFDYGLTEKELISPARAEGTLRAYRGHKLMRDVLADPGDQDITASVNFTAIQSAGEKAGLHTEALQSQTAFLTRIARRAWETDSEFGNWTDSQTRQFQTLTHPEHLGRAFRVLLQSR